MLVDHAFTVPLKLFWPDGDAPAAVPVCINTVQFPLPSAKRCFAMGKAVGEAIAAWDKDMKVVTIGSGGLSHQLDGKRAGFINKPFDLKFMETMVDEPEWATQFSILELVEKTGTQGVELLNWLAAARGLARRDAQGAPRTTTSRSATRPPRPWCSKRREANGSRDHKPYAAGSVSASFKSAEPIRRRALAGRDGGANIGSHARGVERRGQALVPASLAAASTKSTS